VVLPEFGLETLRAFVEADDAAHFYICVLQDLVGLGDVSDSYADSLW